MKRRTRRWGRILFNTLTAISLLLALATAGLWVRSAFHGDGIGKYSWYPTHDGRIYCRYYGISFECGAIHYSRRMVLYYVGLPTTWNRETFMPLDDTPFLQRFVPAKLWPNVYRFAATDELEVSCPFWILLLLFVPLPLLRLNVLLRRPRRNNNGLCPVCGYDTRANPEKCSECGHEIAPV